MDQKDSARRWGAAVSEKFRAKLSAVRERSAEKIPARAVNGVHDDRGDGGDYTPDNGLCWWTNGFWAGMMWQMYRDTGDERYAQIARRTERRLDACFESFLGLHHDVGFMWLPSAVADWRLTGSADSRRRGLHAAGLLAGRFNPAGFIRAWNDSYGKDTRGWAIIDCMLNLSLLYWASEETKDPRFRHMAEIHADTVRKNFVRPDGSVRHIVEFDPETGAFVRDYGGQGLARGSAWTRGQSWGLYGFANSFRHTGRRDYLETSCKIADYFIAHIPEDGKIPVDFDQPAQPAWRDDIAAAAASGGLIELARTVPEKSEEYLAAALKMLRALDATADWNPETDGILRDCSADYHGSEHNVNFVYGDYFFLEAVLKLKGTELFIW